jgi:hypothetical protein
MALWKLLTMVRLCVKLGRQVENIRKYSTQHDIVLTYAAAYSEAKCLGTRFYCDTIQCNSPALCLRLITSTSIKSISFSLPCRNLLLQKTKSYHSLEVVSFKLTVCGRYVQIMLFTKLLQSLSRGIRLPLPQHLFTHFSVYFDTLTSLSRSIVVIPFTTTFSSSSQSRPSMSLMST